MSSPVASASTAALDSPRPSNISSGKRPVSTSSSRPQNLRFQRRTSERAYLEGAYRDGSIVNESADAHQRYSYTANAGMDYSATAGSSPWASSPEASRQSFGDQVEAGESLPPPVVGGHQRGGEEGGWSAEQQHQWQQHAQDQGQQQYSEQQYQQDPRGNGEENRRPASAARYHGAPSHHQPPQQRQSAPQYKLQAKITGLERTGKKDAILRFDVYVRRMALKLAHCRPLT